MTSSGAVNCGHGANDVLNTERLRWRPRSLLVMHSDARVEEGESGQCFSSCVRACVLFFSSSSLFVLSQIVCLLRTPPFADTVAYFRTIEKRETRAGCAREEEEERKKKGRFCS